MKIAVYSNYCGSDTGAKANVNFEPASHLYPHFFYTNNGLVGDRLIGWAVRAIDVPQVNDPVVSCMQAKEQKIRPHLLADLKEFDFVVFRDAKMPRLDLGRLPGYIAKMRERNMYAAFPVHPRNVIAEACESMFQARYFGQRGQISKYITEELAGGGRAQMPVHFGCNMCIRDMRHPDTIPMNERWRQHTDRVGLQDQISFHFVAQDFPMILPIGQEFGFRVSEVPVPE